jgi:DEAD/DEAH box helicase domain-containing protein
MRGIGKALETVATLALMCDPRDIGQTLGDGGDDGELPPTASGGAHAGFDPTIFLFDNVPGGVGLAERIYERADELLSRTRQLIKHCACKSGCPMCVGATSVDPIRKTAALGLLNSIFDA